MAGGQQVMTRFDLAEYRAITAVAATPAGSLTVHFGDGDVAMVNGRRLVRDPNGLCWTKVYVDPEWGDVLMVPREGGDATAIPWDVIRVQTDDAFAAQRARQAEEGARAAGQRVRELRKQRGLTARRVAARAGISAQSLYRIEHSKHRAALGTLARLLGAMGCNWADMVDHDGDELIDEPGA